MSTMQTSGNSYTGDITLAKKTGTVLTLHTLGKYVDKSIQFGLGVQSGAGAADTASADADVVSTGTGNIGGIVGAKQSTAPASGPYLHIRASGSGSSKVTTAGWLDTGALSAASAQADKYFPVQAAQAEVTGTNTVTPSASVSGTNVTLSNTNNGISVTATGGGSASATAGATATQAGYLPSGAVDTATIAAPSQTTQASTYLSGVSIPTPASGNNSFAVTVPAGGSTETYTFQVNASGAASINELPRATGVSF